VLKNFRQKIS